MNLPENGAYPVIHSVRSDRATLIATRVPLSDLWSERWGWILTLNHREGRVGQDDIETLRDNTGQQFPKVYTLTDMRQFIERWSCTEWEEGYHQNDQQASSLNSTAPSSADNVREDVLRQIVSEFQQHQEEKIAAIKGEVGAQLQVLQESSIDFYNNLLEHSRLNHEDTRQKIGGVGEEIEIHVDKVTEAIEAQSVLTREEARHNETTLTEEIRNQGSLAQKHTIEAIEAQFLMAKADTAKHLEKDHEEIKTDLVTFTTELKALEEQIKMALEALDPDIEEDLDKVQNADATSTATKMVRRATTQIERITLSHQKMSMSYFNSANEQSKQGFKLAWSLVFTAIGLLAFTVIAAVFMAILHLYGFTILIGAIGTIGTTIVTVMGAISSFHAKTAEQFAFAQKLLDRSYRPTIANAMCIGFTDDDRKQAAIDKIIDGLLKNEASDVTLK